MKLVVAVFNTEIHLRLRDYELSCGRGPLFETLLATREGEVTVTSSREGQQNLN